MEYIKDLIIESVVIKLRIWHYKLIPVLPKQQLLGQWRELNSIFKNQNRHILINFIYEHEKGELFTYSMLVIEEMNKRKYKVDLTNFDNYFFDEQVDYGIPKEYVFEDKMNKEYFTICYYNLLEKYRCGGITDEEWKPINDLYWELDDKGYY